MKVPVLIASILLFCGQVAAADVVTRANRTIDADQMEIPDEPEWDKPPRLIKGKSPIFPISLLFTGVSGEVVIRYTIGSDGRTRDFEVESAPNQKFADHAIIAVGQWQFRPAMKDGAPVDTRVRQAFGFRGR